MERVRGIRYRVVKGNVSYSISIRVAGYCSKLKIQTPPKQYDKVIDKYSILFRMKGDHPYGRELDTVLRAFPDFDNDYVIHSLKYWGMLKGKRVKLSSRPVKPKKHEVPQTLF